MHRTGNRPKLGQNFLISATAQVAIVDALGSLAQRTVVEIGPGRGAITASLGRRAGHLVAIELDRQLAARLRDQFAEQGSVEIRNEDVLETDFAALRRADPARGRLLVVGNLPYYITSDILLRLFHFAGDIDRAVVMIQREVADRVAAEPGGRDYGLLSATAQLYARVERLMTLPPGAFSPPPQVHSTVLRLTMAPRFAELNVAAEPFLTFLRACFAQKRKMLAKNLRNAGYDPAKISAALDVAGIPPQSRAEEIVLERMARLCGLLSRE